MTTFDTFLRRHESSPTELRDHVSEACGGTPLLAVASGSVLAGYGNCRSDMDICLVFDGPPPPLSSSQPLGGPPIDWLTHDVQELNGLVHALSSGALFEVPALTKRQRDAQAQVLATLSRFEIGVVLAGTRELIDWHQGLTSSRLRQLIADWWRCQASRALVAGTWLKHANYFTAAQLFADAIVAAFESRCALLGHDYFNIKWVGEKLRLLGLDVELAQLRRMLLDAGTGTMQGAPADRLEAAARRAAGSWLSGATTIVVDEAGDDVLWLGGATKMPPQRVLTALTDGGAHVGVVPANERRLVVQQPDVTHDPPQPSDRAKECHDVADRLEDVEGALLSDQLVVAAQAIRSLFLDSFDGANRTEPGVFDTPCMGSLTLLPVSRERVRVMASSLSLVRRALAATDAPAKSSVLAHLHEARDGRIIGAAR